MLQQFMAQLVAAMGGKPRAGGRSLDELFAEYDAVMGSSGLRDFKAIEVFGQPGAKMPEGMPYGKPVLSKEERYGAGTGLQGLGKSGFQLFWGVDRGVRGKT